MKDEAVKPTIRELEEILSDTTPRIIDIAPDGSISVSEDLSAELGRAYRRRDELEAFLASAVELLMQSRRYIDEDYSPEADAYLSAVGFFLSASKECDNE